MAHVRRYWITPPWHEDAEVADRTWRTVIAALGPGCDVLWLRFGNLEDLRPLLPAEEYLWVEGLIGPHWGKPDPHTRTSAYGSGESLLGGMLQGIADDFAQAGFISPVAPAQPQKYTPYGSAVVPVTPALIDRLSNLRAVDPDRTREMLSRLADHWHFRVGERDLFSTDAGMAGIGLNLTPDEFDLLRRNLLAAGLPPDILAGPQTEQQP